ncbi:hypothetical protein [Kitasatospora sp. NPDC090308]|uniref:hypothetical protein n=1 Tax=Kitasatospora sp. NPDC090308 TaxID=3364082 RepID=UPI0038229E96
MLATLAGGPSGRPLAQLVARFGTATVEWMTACDSQRCGPAGAEAEDALLEMDGQGRHLLDMLDLTLANWAVEANDVRAVGTLSRTALQVLLASDALHAPKGTEPQHAAVLLAALWLGPHGPARPAPAVPVRRGPGLWRLVARRWRWWQAAWPETGPGR